MSLYITNKQRENISTSKVISPFSFIEITIEYKVTLARMINNRLCKLSFLCDDADDVLNKVAVQSNLDDETFELISKLRVDIIDEQPSNY